MKFTWETFDTSFLKSIIDAADVEDKELYLRTEDKESIVGCVNSICDYPDKRFIYDYRNINLVLIKLDEVNIDLEDINGWMDG